MSREFSEGEDEQDSSNPTREALPSRKASASRGPDLIQAGGAWLVALSVVLFAIYLGWQVKNSPSPVLASAEQPTTQAAPTIDTLTQVANTNVQDVALPDFLASLPLQSISRSSELHTQIPTRPREDIITYTVGTGDSVFGIAKSFNLQPESVLWANYSTLKDSPDMLSPGMTLNIPPTDGVFYEVKEGDTLDGIAQQFQAKPSDILNWSGNHIDLFDPKVKAGEKVMIPGGKREFVQWVIPTIPRGQAGVSPSVYGAGACAGGYSGAFGSGTFIWPSAQHVLSGNDYWSGHLGIDIAGQMGDAVFASDSGVVVFSGWSTGGYGYMIMIDHGNGYQTVYAHLSVASAGCGASVGQGQYIGSIGSTGNSTGAHLHFEVRYLGGFVNPWYTLPAP